MPKVTSIVGKTVVAARVTPSKIHLEFTDGSIFEAGVVDGVWPPCIQEMQCGVHPGFLLFPQKSKPPVRIPYERVVTIQAEDKMTCLTSVRSLAVDEDSLVADLASTDVTSRYEWWSLKHYHKLMPFLLQVHRNTLVNPHFIRAGIVEYSPRGDGILFLQTPYHTRAKNNLIQVSRRYTIEVKRWLRTRNLL